MALLSDATTRPVSRRRHAVPALAAAIGLFGCAGGAPQRERLDEETYSKLAAAERAWLAQSPDYVRLREELRADPLSAAWLTRMLISKVIHAREARALGSEKMVVKAERVPEVVRGENRPVDPATLLRGERNPMDRRAIDELAELGADAVPTLREDLLLSDQIHLRQYGVELMGAVGRPALPALLEVSRASSPRDRRTAARALTAMADLPEAAERLRELARDRDFTVRADAVRGLRRGNAADAVLLRWIVREDEDPFVRRTAATALAGHPGRETVEALIDYLERCRNDVDPRGFDAAQSALGALAGPPRRRTVAAWRRWASSLGSE